MDLALSRWLHALLPGPITQLTDWSWPDGKAAVFEVRDGVGDAWFVKQHRDYQWYRPEHAAYVRWVPALGERAPRLVASDLELRALLLSALPRGGGDWRDDAVRHDAGAVLRRLHDAEALGRCADLAAEKRADLEQWARRGAGLLSPGELDFAFAAVRALDGLPAPERVPCHGDFTPRNWVISGDRVHVVDFEETRPDAWISDFGRMAIAWWWAEPHLIEPVFDGYARTPSTDEIALMRCCFAVTAVRLIVLGTEFGKDELVAGIGTVVEHLRKTL